MPLYWQGLGKDAEEITKQVPDFLTKGAWSPVAYVYFVLVLIVLFYKLPDAIAAFDMIDDDGDFVDIDIFSTIPINPSLYKGINIVMAVYSLYICKISAQRFGTMAFTTFSVLTWVFFIMLENKLMNSVV